MDFRDRLQADLGAAVTGADRGQLAADRLCRACVDLLEVDGAALSVTLDGTMRGTFGSSSEQSRRVDEFQFTAGEGPCMEAVLNGRPVLVADVEGARQDRWPAFSSFLLDSGIRAVFAMPVSIAASTVGALDLFRRTPGELSDDGMVGGMRAAELAVLPLLDLLTAEANWVNASEGEDAGSQLASLERVEVYQATGMIMGQLNVGPAEAMARLRAHAFAEGQTASEVAWSIVERRLVLDADDAWRSEGGGTGTPA